MQYRVTVRSPLTVAIASLCAVSLIAQQREQLGPAAGSVRRRRAPAWSILECWEPKPDKLEPGFVFKRAVGILSPHALAFLPPRYWHSALDCTRVFTWIISHAGWSHLMGNLPTLLLLGPGLESEVQPPRVPPPQPESGNAQRRSRGAA